MTTFEDNLNHDGLDEPDDRFISESDVDDADATVVVDLGMGQFMRIPGANG